MPPVWRLYVAYSQTEQASVRPVESSAMTRAAPPRPTRIVRRAPTAGAQRITCRRDRSTVASQSARSEPVREEDRPACDDQQAAGHRQRVRRDAAGLEASEPVAGQRGAAPDPV